MTVTVVDPPTADAGDDDSVCAGNSVQLAGSAANHTSVVWTTSGDGSFDDASVLDAVYTPGAGDVAAGSVTLTLTANALPPCTGVASDSLTITIGDNPTPVITADPGESVCEGATVTLDAGPGYDSYSWSTGATTQTIEVTPTATTTYSVTVTLGDCEGSGEITITVSDNPTPVITADPGESVCEGATVTLDAGPGYNSYSWSTGETTQTIAVTPTETTAYDVTVTLGDCEGSGEITITVSDNPTPVITADPGESVCEGATVTLDAGPGYNSYSWSTGETTQTIAVTPTETTAYDVTVTLGDCEGSGEITITVSDNPTPVITADPGRERL